MRQLLLLSAFFCVVAVAHAQSYNPSAYNGSLSRTSPIDLTQGENVTLSFLVGNLGLLPMDRLGAGQRMQMTVSLLGVVPVDLQNPGANVTTPPYFEYSGYDPGLNVMLFTQRAAIPAGALEYVTIHARLTSFSISDQQRSINGFTVNAIPPGYTNTSNVSTDDVTYSYGYTSVPVLLPVELVNFKVEVENCQSKIKWATASELNNDFFAIRKSTDAVNWSEIAQVEGNGTTSTPHQYEYLDTEINSTGTYYQLVQNDFDGTKDYSKIVFVENVGCSQQFAYNIYPNPVQEMVNIDLYKTEDIFQGSIYNAAGQYIKPLRLNPSKNSVYVGDLIPGIYLLRAEADGERISHTFIVQR